MHAIYPHFGELGLFASTRGPDVGGQHLPFTVATPADYVRQVSFSRICGGVHFRSTAEASEAMARRIAANALAKFALPL